MTTLKILFGKLANRARHLSLTEILLLALLLSSWFSLSEQDGIQKRLSTIDDSLGDLQHKVGSESSDVQSKLDEIYSELEEIYINQ